MERRRKQTRNKPPQNPRRRIKIFVTNRQKIVLIDASSVKRLVSFVLEIKKVRCEEIAIYFVSKKKITKIHADFFQDPTPTDCITFPLDKNFLGEIFVCPEVAKEYDPAHPLLETSLYIIHGILHLLGFNDMETKERKAMQREQNRLLKAAQKHKCILQTSS